MKRILFNLFADENLIHTIKMHTDSRIGKMIIRQFPDEETYLKIELDVKGDEVIVVASLDRPNAKMIPLLFFAKTARDLGAKRVSLLAPYLPYMRQDQVFNPGEGITSDYFASLLSNYFDELITIDPHLHRKKSLNEIYTIPTVVLSAADEIAKWIKHHVNKPILIGPDQESEQWVSTIAQKADAPFVVLEKTRKGDKEVEVSIPHIDQYKIHTPVLIDDIISTARTMIETVKHVKNAKMKSPICIGVHAIFSGDAYHDLLAAGAVKVITCNTIKHESNAIDLSEIIIDYLKHKR